MFNELLRRIEGVFLSNSQALKEIFKEDEYKYLAFSKDREQVVIKIVR